MGRLGALGMAEEVGEGNVSLQAAVSWHLTSNHYPPHPAFMVPVAVAAVEAGQEEAWDREIELPDGCVEHRVILDDSNAAEHVGCHTEPVVEWRNSTRRTVPARDIIESFHLDSFLE